MIASPVREAVCAPFKLENRQQRFPEATRAPSHRPALFPSSPGVPARATVSPGSLPFCDQEPVRLSYSPGDSRGREHASPFSVTLPIPSEEPPYGLGPSINQHVS